MRPELLKAVEERVKNGVSQEAIIAELKAVGYGEEAIVKVMTTVTRSIESGGAVSPSSVLLVGVGEAVSRAVSLITQRLDLFSLNLAPAVGFVATNVFIKDDTALVATSVIFTVLQIIAVLVTTYIFLQADKRVVSINEALSWSSVHFLGFLWVSILATLVMLGGFTLFIIPGIILMVPLALVAYRFVDKGQGGMQALYECRDLVKGWWWEVAIRLLPMLALVIFSYIVDGLLSVFSSEISVEVVELFGSLFNTVLVLLYTAFGSVVYTSLVASRPLLEVKRVGVSYVLLAALGLIAPILFVLGIVLLSGLNDARDAGQAAALKQNLNNLRVQAEIYYENESQTYDGFCVQAENILAELSTKTVTVFSCEDGLDDWNMKVESDGSMYCVSGLDGVSECE